MAPISAPARAASVRGGDEGVWRLTLEGGVAAAARVLVNAAGPFVTRVLGDVVGEAAPRRVRLVKGSHIVVPRLFTHDRAYIFQNADGRVCFAIPYESDFTLIGTTDEDFHGDRCRCVEHAGGRSATSVTRSAITCRQPVDPGDIVWRYAGVRPLLDDGASKAQEATRDYVLTLEAPEDGAPLLSVFGGKVTTYRRLAEAALAKLARFLPRMRRRGPPAPHCRAAIFRGMAWIRCEGSWRGAIRSCRRPRIAAWFEPMARLRRRCLATRAAWRRWVAVLVRI